MLLNLVMWGCQNSLARINEGDRLELPGVGNGPTVRGLLNIQKEEDTDILFLSETKMDCNRIEGLRWHLGMTNLVVKDCCWYFVRHE